MKGGYYLLQLAPPGLRWEDQDFFKTQHLMEGISGSPWPRTKAGISLHRTLSNSSQVTFIGKTTNNFSSLLKLPFLALWSNAISHWGKKFSKIKKQIQFPIGFTSNCEFPFIFEPQWSLWIGQEIVHQNTNNSNQNPAREPLLLLNAFLVSPAAPLTSKVPLRQYKFTRKWCFWKGTKPLVGFFFSFQVWFFQRT